jgi:hypothetical protein
VRTRGAKGVTCQDGERGGVDLRCRRLADLPVELVGRIRSDQARYAMADFLALGAAQALTKAGKNPKDVPIVGTGFSRDGQKGIKDATSRYPYGGRPPRNRPCSTVSSGLRYRSRTSALVTNVPGALEGRIDPGS